MEAAWVAPAVAAGFTTGAWVGVAAFVAVGAGADAAFAAESGAAANAAPANPAVRASRAAAVLIVRCIPILLEAARTRGPRTGRAV